MGVFLFLCSLPVSLYLETSSLSVLVTRSSVCVCVCCGLSKGRQCVSEWEGSHMLAV